VLRGEVLAGDSAGEYRIRTLDGGELFVSVTAAPIRDRSGHVTGGVLVLRDVTDRQRRERRAQEVLSGLVAMAEALVETSPETSSDRSPVSAKHIDVTDAPANQTAQRLIALAHSILGGQRIDLISVDWDTGIQRPVATVRPTPAEERQWWASVPLLRVYEYVNAALMARLSAGEIVQIDRARGPGQAVLQEHVALAAPVRVREHLVGLLLVEYGGADHAVRAEERAVVGAVAKLAALAIEREQLLQEQAAAGAHASALEAANQQMDEFLGIAAHELKAPVTTSTLAVQLAASRLKNRIGRKTADRDEQAGQLLAVEELLARADHSMARLGRLMINLLDVVGIRAGKLEMRSEPCDLADIVRDALEDERQLVPTRTLRLHLPARRSVPVIADATRIGEVVANYLSNAVKYSPADTPVTVQLRLEGEWARVSVRDKGLGLSKKEQEHLWERFHRVPGTQFASGAGIGLGLGLHICKTLVERHHGHVGVRSTPGRGSTFWFTLPVDPTRA
jgi:signal transduction histidine kinase